MTTRNVFNRQIRKLQQKWIPEDYARRIAYKQQLANWRIEEWSYRLTDEWKEYSNLYSEKRAVARANKTKQNRQWRKNSAIKNLF